MRSSSTRLLLWLAPLILGAFFTLAGAAAAAHLGWSWDQVSIRQNPAGEAACGVDGAAFHYAKPGEPDLPAVLVEIQAPEGQNVASFDITGQVTSDHDLAWPVAAMWEDRPSDAGGPVPVPPLRDAYQAISYPSERVRFLGLSAKRGVSLASFAVYPLTLERGHKLILLEQGTLTVRWTPDPNVRIPLKSLRPESEMTLRRDFLGKNGVASEQGSAVVVSGRPSLSGTAVRYLVVTIRADSAAIQPLIDWKNVTGTPTATRTVEWIYQNYPEGVDKQERIRNFLREAYLYWGTEWLLIVGGPDQVPIRTARTYSWNYPTGTDIITDYYYACLDGTWNGNGNAIFGQAVSLPGNPTGDDTDMSPELMVGRVPAATSTQVGIWMTKYLNYLRNPDRGGYLDRSLNLGEVLFHAAWSRSIMDRCGIQGVNCATDCNRVCVEMDGASDCINAIGIMDSSDVHLVHTEMYEYFEYWQAHGRPDAVLERKSDVLTNLNAGAGWIQHVGHGANDRISVGTDNGLSSDARLLSVDAHALTNQGKPGIIYSINCTSAAINSDCIAEAFLFAPNGGEIAYVGSSNLDFPTTARAYQSLFFRKVFYDKEEDGRAFSEVLDELARGIGNDENQRRFLSYSLIFLGDPQLKAWLGTPTDLSISTQTRPMTLGDSTYQVTVTKGGGALANAQVCLYKAGDVYGVGKTNASGSAIVPFRPATTGDFQLTVTDIAGVPVIQPAVVGPSGSPSAIQAIGMLIGDGTVGGQPRTGTTGNGNGRFETGETVDLDVTLRNVGNASASNVQVTLFADSMASYLDIVKGSASYSGSIGSGSSATLIGAFRVKVKSSIPSKYFQNGDRLAFDTRINVHDGPRTGAFRIPLYAYRPVLRLHHADLVENGPGNHDNRPDDGEYMLWTPLFRNLGTGTVSNMRAYLADSLGATMVVDSLDVESPIEQGNSFSTVPGPDGTFQFRVDDAQHLKLRLTVRSTLQRDIVLFTRKLEFIFPNAPTFPADTAGTLLRLQGSKDAIVVVWRKPVDRDVQGYILKRATESTGSFLPVTGDLLTRMQYYQDQGLPGLTRFYYKVAAVDSSGNQSSDSGLIDGTTSPGLLTGWPVNMGDNSYGCPTVENIDQVGPNEIFTNADVLYGWKADGGEIIDGDHLSSTTGIWSTSGSQFWTKTAVGDINRDGKPEIVAASRKSVATSGWSQILAWSDTGTLLWQKTVGAGSANLLGSPVLADIAGDQKLEAVVELDGGLYAWNSDGSPVIPGNTNGLLIQVAQDTPYTYGSPAAADLDGDGKDEILFAYGSSGGPSKLSVVKVAAGAASVLSTVDIGLTGATGSCSSSPVVANIDGTWEVFVDGRKYLMGYRWASNRLETLWHVWHGEIVAKASKPYDPTCAIGDVDGDGALEVVAPGATGTLYCVSAATGDSIAPFPIQLAPTSARLGSPILVDLDQTPSTAEIVIGDDSGVVYGLSGAGDTAGELLRGFPYQVDGEIDQGLACWDVNRNGNPDLMIQAFKSPSLTILSISNVTFPSDLGTAMDRNPWTSFRHDARNTGRLDAHVLTPVMTMEAQAAEEIGAATIRWQSSVQPATFRVERSGDDGVWAARVEGPPSSFADGSAGDGSAYSYRDVTDPGAFTYRVTGFDAAGSAVLQSVQMQVVIRPVRLRLIGAVPNPFNPRTMIRFESPGGSILLEIIDLAGRRVRTLSNGTVTAGSHDVIWDGKDGAGRGVGSGIYLARLRGTGGARSQKVVLLR